MEELDDVRQDPIEVTLDKNTKKELLVHLTRLSGDQDDEKYWETCLREHVELQTDVFLELGCPDGQPHAPPALPGLPADHHDHQGHAPAALHGLPADHHDHQGHAPHAPQTGNDYQRLRRKPPQLPEPDDLNERCKQLRKAGSRAKWGHEQGFLTMLCVDPLRIPLRKVGPGHRTCAGQLFVTGVPGVEQRKLRRASLTWASVPQRRSVIFYGWDSSGLARRPEGDHEIFAETTDISAQEKRAVLRSHVNL